MNEIVKLIQQGKYQPALKKCKSLLKKAPSHPVLYNAIGAILIKTNKLSEARKNCLNAIQLAPDYADAHNNLAVIAYEKGEFDQTINHCKKTLSLAPNHVNAYLNLGNALKETGHWDQAIQNYLHVVKLQPQYAEGHFNLANAFRETGNTQQAIAHYEEAIRINPQLWKAYNNIGGVFFETGQAGKALNAYGVLLKHDAGNEVLPATLSSVLENMTFEEFDEKVEHILLFLLKTQKEIRPIVISACACRLLLSHPVMREIHNHQITNQTIKILDQQPLLIALLKKAPIVHAELEHLLANVRKFILFNNTEWIKTTYPSFFEALAVGCFISEFVFFETPEEKQEIARLEKQELTPANLLSLALYRPLYNYDLSEFLKTVLPRQVLNLHINNRETEIKLAATIKSLTNISNETSQAVQKQYEENPYPRWIDTALYKNPETYDSLAQRYLLRKTTTLPISHILIAGCGTGQHVLHTASRIKHKRLTALDLSKTSLAYACRKTQEYGIQGVNFVQGDILDIRLLNEEFDHIESIGVLHHMADPIKGWKALYDVLRPQGTMFIALYSERARAHIASFRESITPDTKLHSAQDIRTIRQNIFQSETAEFEKIAKSRDFYSLSNCRDLILHEQEHRFTIPQIAQIIEKLDLKFLGFELDNRTRNAYLSCYHDPDNLYDLKKWEIFEKENPSTFASMYQFWVQKN